MMVPADTEEQMHKFGGSRSLPNGDQGEIETLPAAYGTTPSARECRYCTRIVAATQLRSGTCATCAAKWEATFGEFWWEEEWHTDPAITEMHRDFVRASRVPTISLDGLRNITEENRIEAHRAGWLPDPAFYQVFQTMKDIYIRKQLGWKRMKRELIEVKASPLPCDTQVKKYLRIIKSEMLALEIEPNLVMKSEKPALAGASLSIR